MGWIGNLFIIVGLWKVGDKVRSAFIYTMIGEAFFAVHTGMNRDWPIFVAVLIFFSLAARNWWKWRSDESRVAAVAEQSRPNARELMRQERVFREPVLAQPPDSVKVQP